jgi:hypothetical protein
MLFHQSKDTHGYISFFNGVFAKCGPPRPELDSREHRQIIGGERRDRQYGAE